ncbi:MAG TPA: glycosyltransferase family 2 protein [Planktothrix sp.]|jgi:hypothetical protein
MPDHSPAITIVVLNWNGWKDTRECLATLRQVTYANFSVLLVDNGSSDGSIDFAREQFPEVEIIATGKNLGFAEGSNVGIKRGLESGAEYIMLLNNDTLLSPGFIDPLLEALQQGCDVVSPLIFYASDPKVVWFGGSKIDWLRGWPYHAPANVEDTGQFASITDLEYVSGCCLTASAATWRQVGLLDERYFAYFEDADWSVRAIRLGLRTALVPASRIWHKVSQAPMMRPVGAFLFVRNGLLFIRKQVKLKRGQVYYRFILDWVVKPIYREIKRNDFSPALASARWRGILAHLRGSYGTPYA